MTYYPSASGSDPHFQQLHQDHQSYSSPSPYQQRTYLSNATDTIKVSLATLAGGTYTSSTRSSTPSSFSPQSPTSYTSGTDDTSMTDAKNPEVKVKLPRRNNGPGAVSAAQAAAGVISQQVPSGSTSGKGGPDVVYFTETLYIEGLSPSVNNDEIRDMMRDCRPLDVQIYRDPNMYTAPANGYIRFPSSDYADRAYALFNNILLAQHGCLLKLNMNDPNIANEPEVSANILQVKQLGPSTDNTFLYNLFRPYGALQYCRTVLDNSRFKGVALVQYFRQEDADDAQRELHCKEVNGSTISVTTYVPQKNRTFSPQTSQQPIPNGQSYPTSLNVAAPPFQFNPQGGSNAGPPSPSPAEPTATMDPCNLYIKNLDLNIKSSDLFNNFRKFGRIISARVMNNPITGQSKGFGFVSFSKAEEASKALAEMNGKLVMLKQIVVAYHEPKKPRDKLSSNSASSPDSAPPERRPSVDVRSMQPQPSPTTLFPPGAEGFPRHEMLRRYSSPVPYAPTQMSHSVPAPTNPDGTINLDFLSSLGTAPGDVRSEILRNEFHRRVSGSGTVSHGEVELIVNNLLQLNFHDITTMLKYPQALHDKIKETKDALHPKPQLPLQTMPMSMYAQERKTSAQYTSQPPIVAITPAASNPMSQRTAPVAQMASLPNNSQLSQHNVSFAPQYSFTPPSRPTLRRKGSLESISSVMTEGSSLSQKKRMHDAVVRLGEGDYVDDIVDMLLTLKRKERSLCLFNADFLRDKVKSAKEALDVFQDDDVDFSAFTTSTPTTPIPQSIPKPTSKTSKAVASGISTTPPAATVTKIQMSSQIATTLPTLPSAQVSAPTTSLILPLKSKAIPIVAPRAQSPTTPEPQIVAPGNSKADEMYTETERFWGSISHLPQQDKKQKLGDKLFPLVKATGVKPAPKITIRLLDTIELRVLAHLMYDGNTLKEKAKEAAASL